VKRLVHHVVLAGYVEEGLLEVGEGVDVWLLRRLDGHCRSHNISAECCVASRCGREPDLGSSASKAGGEMVMGRSEGSILIVG
jgi:hypothetical protein